MAQQGKSLSKDEIDFIHEQHGKMTYKEIASYIGCSAVTVSYHVKKLGLKEREQIAKSDTSKIAQVSRICSLFHSHTLTPSEALTVIKRVINS